MKDLTPVLGAIITLVVFGIGTFLIPFIKQKLGEAKTEELMRWIKIFVRAAEQIFRESGLGAEKKQYVLDRLAEMGYSVDTEALNEMIEAAVLELNREVIASKVNIEKISEGDGKK